MNNIEYLNQRILDLEKENNRLKNAIVHLVKDFPTLEEMVAQENRESIDIRPLPGVKVLFPDFNKHAKELALLVKHDESLFKNSELDFIQKAQRVIHPSKKQNDWLESIYSKRIDDIQRYCNIESSINIEPYDNVPFNEENPLDF